MRKETITDIELNIPDLPDESGYDRDTISRLNAAIRELPAKCRHVLYLAKIQKLPYREIARILGISVKTVSNHLTYAMKRLTTAMKGHGNDALIILAVLTASASVPIPI